MTSKKYWILAVVSSAFVTSMWSFVLVGAKTHNSIEDKKTKNDRVINTESHFVTIDISKIKHIGKGRDTLLGLPGVHVSVEGLNAEARKYGLMDQVLQTDVELPLRRYNISVLSKEEMLRTRGMRELYVKLNCVTNELSAAVNIDVKLEEIALLTTRYPVMACVDATTWEKSCVLIVGVHKIATVREDVRDLVNEFINDYLTANSKEHPTKKNLTESNNNEQKRN